MRCIAHRGFAETYPENTVGAVRAATDHADAVEVDVRRCGSGDLVAVHDETVDRVTDGTGAIADLSLADLRSLDVLGSGEGIPPLRAVLDAAADRAEVVLDVKEANVVADALDAADDAGATVLVSSFSRSVLETAAAASDAPLAYLTRAEGADDALATASELGCRAVHPHWHACVDAFVSAAHDRDLRVNAWTVPSRHDVAALADVGVDGVVVDRPEAVVRSR